MSDKTAIEWTDATWNPTTGCQKVSAGCKHCYAEREWPRMTRLVPAYAWRAFGDVRCHHDRLDQPLRWRKPRKVFVNSMSDLFHPDVPDAFIHAVFTTMAKAPQHVFQVLTKRPERMRELLRLWVELGLTLREGSGAVLPNVWLGVSVENQSAADERIPLLLDTPAAVRWISAEPLLGPVDLNQLLVDQERGLHGSALHEQHDDCYYQSNAQLDWVVVGGESGPKARPMHPEWARSLRDQCAAAGVPFLFKQWGEWGTIPGHGAHYPAGIAPDGSWVGAEDRFTEDCALMYRIGKKAAGRLLDGHTHDGFPEVRP